MAPAGKPLALIAGRVDMMVELSLKLVYRAVGDRGAASTVDGTPLKLVDYNLGSADPTTGR